MVRALINLPHNRPLIAKANRNHPTLPRKIAILYSDVQRKYFPTYEEYLTEKDAVGDAEAFIPYLKKLGVKTVLIPADKQLAANLQREKPDMAINTAATVKGYDYLAASVPATLEMLEIPYTGSSIEGFLLGANKFLINTLLQQFNVPVPRFSLLSRVDSPLPPSLRYPLILKLNGEHSNVEITREAVVENEPALRGRLKYLLLKYKQDVLVSEFIDGREFAAFAWQSPKAMRVYVIERLINLPGNKTGHQFMDYDLVWHPGKTEADYAQNLKYQPYRDSRLDVLVKKAFAVAKMEDYGKFDIRQDKKGNYYFIDANANCYLATPEQECELSRTLKANGIPFTLALKQLMENTMREWGL